MLIKDRCPLTLPRAAGDLRRAAGAKRFDATAQFRNLGVLARERLLFEGKYEFVKRDRVCNAALRLTQRR